MFTWLDALINRFQAWRAAKAGADLAQSEAEVEATAKAAEVISKLAEPPKPPAVIVPPVLVPVKP